MSIGGPRREERRCCRGWTAGVARAAHYDDKLVRTPEGWRIAERIEKQVILEGALPQKPGIPQ